MAKQPIKEQVEEQVKELTSPISDFFKKLFANGYVRSIAVGVILYFTYLLFGADTKEKVKEVIDQEKTESIDSVKVDSVTIDTVA